MSLHDDGPGVVGGGAACGVVDLAAISDGGGSGGGGAGRGRRGRQAAAEVTQAVIAQFLVDSASSLNCNNFASITERPMSEKRQIDGCRCSTRVSEIAISSRGGMNLIY